MTAIGPAAVARLLLNSGANAQAKGKEGRTPLDWAVSEGHAALAELLRKHATTQAE